MASNQRQLLPKPELSTDKFSGLAQFTLNPGAQKKRKVVVYSACKACQARKSKCDGVRPTCQSCKDKTTVCEYEFAPGQTRHVAQKQRINRAETANATLLEILRHLKTQPVEEAHRLLEFIRSEDSDVSTIHSYLRDHQSRNDQGALSSEIESVITPASLLRLDSAKASPASDSANTLFDTTSSIIVSEIPSILEASDNTATAATVITAISMFFQCAYSLFFVFTKEQAESTIKDVLGDVEQLEASSFLDFTRENHPLQRSAQIAELCGMAAVGLLYSQPSDSEDAPPASLAEYFYASARRMLDFAIEHDSLRAMKVCALLAEYNIISKSPVALAYAELGLGLGRQHGLDSTECPPTMEMDDFMDWKKTWRTLFLFSGWLDLGYVAGTAGQSFEHLQLDKDVMRENPVDGELDTVTMIKAHIIQNIPNNRLAKGSEISTCRDDLTSFYGALPDGMSMNNLVKSGKELPLRTTILYLHLFYLSAMQFLHRRVLANLAEFSSSPAVISEEAKVAVRDGLMAAKMAARIVSQMLQEGSLVQYGWMCIFILFTTAIIILQAGIQKILNGYHHSLWIADLTLVTICAEMLEYCAEVDKVALKFKAIVMKYLEVVNAAVDGEMNEDASKNIDEQGAMDYLFYTHAGDTDLHKAARDVFYLVRRPFGTALELMLNRDPTDSYLRIVVVHWMNAAAEGIMESKWELLE